MSIKNYKVAAALAIFCTLLWGTAFPFIKVGYAQFGIEGNDIGSKLLFAGARFTLAGIMVLFIFLVKNKHLPKIEKTALCLLCCSVRCRLSGSIFLHISA